MKKIIISGLMASLLINFYSCKKDKPAPVPDEQELITTLKIRVTDSAGFAQTFQYKIVNGYNTGNPNVQIDTLKLPANKRLYADLSVLDESKTPIDDITAEILEKSDEHLFVFQSTPTNLLQVVEGNKDTKGQALNQSFVLNSGNAGSGSFQVHLLHLPTNKNGTTVQSAGGETDLEATFPVFLQ